jgi:hypothetical protein
MKHLILAAGFVAVLGAAQFTAPVQAQGNVQALCQNKYGLGKNWNTASEAARKDAAAKIAACVRSGGKS